MKWRRPWSRRAATSWHTTGRETDGCCRSSRTLGMVLRSLEGGKEGSGAGAYWHQKCQSMFPQGLGIEQTPSLTEEQVGADTENRGPYMVELLS